MVLDYEGVRKLLRHRFPFLMIDYVRHFESRKKLIALKNVTGNEIHFLGHFPEIAIMPGVLLIEAMAQAGSLLLLMDIGEQYLVTQEDVIFLAGVDKARFLKPVVPGDQLIINVTPIKLISNAGIISSEVMVNTEVVARAQFTFGQKNRTNSQER